MSGVILKGNTSGQVELSVPAVAGTNIIDVPAASGQMALISNLIGWNQTWQDVTASRALGTTYTNSTGKPIMIGVNASGSTISATYKVTVGGVDLLTIFTGAIQPQGAVWVIVPDGATYSVSQVVATVTLSRWVELR